MMRIGHGFDVHAFGPGDHVILGGEKIAHSSGLIAHSDGDRAARPLRCAAWGRWIR
jgi:2-C-methyl-D-erythritol 2,4-cyclodiphosphate synthase